MTARMVAGLLVAAGLWAQTTPDRVGRVSLLYGPVSFRPGTTPDWSDATLNLPLSDGDHLWTDLNAQAEVWAGPVAVHMAPQTGFSIVQLTDSTTRLGVSEGAVNLWIARLEEGETVEVVTPAGSFRLLRPGSYRLDAVTAGNYITFTVRSGFAQATAGPLTSDIAPGQRIVLAGNPASTEMLEALPLDAWDEWCAARDHAAERGIEQAEPYIAWDMPGAEELAANGDWETDAELGAYWTPGLVDDNWAPFRNGHWIFKLPWGWTWVDAAPWGFAPSHYGRWAKVKKGWGWVPPKLHHKQPYSPATVAFSGATGGLVRWAPLAPGETAANGASRNRDASSASEVAAFRTARPVSHARLPDSPAAFTAKTAPVEPAPEAFFGGTIHHPKPQPPAPVQVRATAPVQRQPVVDHRTPVVEETHRVDASTTTHYDDPPRVHRAEESSSRSESRSEEPARTPEPQHHEPERHSAPAPAPAPAPTRVESHPSVQEHHPSSSSNSSSGRRK